MYTNNRLVFPHAPSPKTNTLRLIPRLEGPAPASLPLGSSPHSVIVIFAVRCNRRDKSVVLRSPFVEECED